MNKPSVELVCLLKELLDPSFSKLFFSDNGSTAIEVAIKMVYQYWKNNSRSNRKIFVMMQGNYNGDTFGAISVGKSCNFYKQFEDLFFHAEYLLYPDTWFDDLEINGKEYRLIAYTEKFLHNNADNVVCFLLESIV